MISWPESVLPVVGFIDQCRLVMPLSIGLCTIEVLVTGHRDHCVGMLDVVLNLWAWSCCVGREVVSIF